jgi:hypothetical protein
VHYIKVRATAIWILLIISLKNNANVHADNDCALYLSAIDSHLDIVNHLIEK